MFRPRWLAGVTVALATTVAASGVVWAQDPPTTNSGPQFGTTFGPERAAPAPEVQAEAAPPRLGAPAPGAPAPQAPAPQPNVYSGCNYNLAGNWSLSGWETQPVAFHYTGSLQIQQYGQWIQATQEQGGQVLQYYGQCNGDSLRLDVYQGSTFIGYQYGTVDWGGRWNALRISFNWNTWAPNYATGNESWRRVYM